MKTELKIGDKIKLFNTDHVILHVPNEEYELYILEYVRVDKWLQKSIDKAYYSAERLELIINNHNK
jgi:hypothetical protein